MAYSISTYLVKKWDLGELFPALTARNCRSVR